MLLDEKDATIFAVQSKQETTSSQQQVFQSTFFPHSTTLKTWNNRILFTAAKIFNLHLVTKSYIFVCAHVQRIFYFSCADLVEFYYVLSFCYNL